MLGMTCLCCDDEHPFAIVIHNSNSAIDDNFIILLNGTNIGSINNNQNALTGRIFAQQADPVFDKERINSPNPNVFQTTLNLDMNLLLVGQNNTLRVQSSELHNNGNFGKVQAGFWELNENQKYFLSTALLDTNYSYVGGVIGDGQNFNFVYNP